MRRPSLAPSLALAVSLVVPLGCTKKPQLTEVAVPEAGVSLRYDLSPGQAYSGRVRMRNSFQTPMGDVVTSLEFEVALQVSANSGAQGQEGQMVQCIVDAVELSLRLPDGVPAEAVGMNPESAKALNGMELRFNIDEFGDVSNEPEAPEDATPEMKGMIDMVSGALTASFVRVPEQPLKDGESWDATSKDPGEGVSSAKSTGTLQGLARNEAGEDLAQLVFVAEMEATRGGMNVVSKQEVEASFSATGGYPVTVERKINSDLAGKGSISSEIEAEWTKGAKQAVEAAPAGTEAQPGTEIQAITDPCDPDYVGAGECADDAVPPAAEAAPAAEATTN